MVNCSTTIRSSRDLEFGSEAIPWDDDMSYARFIEYAFPKAHGLTFDNFYGPQKSRSVKLKLKATRLRRVARLRLEATDDLSNHLSLDQEQGVLQIYHHTAFLKESLDAQPWEMCSEQFARR